MAKISKKLRIKWNFELTVFELTVPDLYIPVVFSRTEFKYQSLLPRIYPDIFLDQTYNMAVFLKLMLSSVTLTFMVLKVESITDQQFQVRKTTRDFSHFATRSTVDDYVIITIYFHKTTVCPNTCPSVRSMYVLTFSKFMLLHFL